MQKCMDAAVLWTLNHPCLSLHFFCWGEMGVNRIGSINAADGKKNLFENSWNGLDISIKFWKILSVSKAKESWAHLRKGTRKPVQTETTTTYWTIQKAGKLWKVCQQNTTQKSVWNDDKAEAKTHTWERFVAWKVLSTWSQFSCHHRLFMKNGWNRWSRNNI